jgi:hypothetical protein
MNAPTSAGSFLLNFNCGISTQAEQKSTPCPLLVGRLWLGLWLRADAHGWAI